MIALLLFATVEASSFASTTTALIDSYRNCLMNESVNLEASGAEFEDVFKAAETACIHVWANTQEAVTVELQRRPPASGREAADVAFEFLENAKSSWKNAARLALLRQRASHKGK